MAGRAGAATVHPIDERLLFGRTESDMPGLTLAEWRSWQHFLEASLRLTARLNQQLVDKHDLTLDDVRLLHALSLSPDRSMRMGQLADVLAGTPSRITRQLSRLEARGLAARRRCADDGRGVIASITETGCRLVSDAVVTYSKGVRSDYLGQLTRPQVIAISDCCRRLVGR
ncbi:MarR family transcriptional regulator [Mycobacterium sp. MYCO198283]|uniref:MarR family winged helix-turn-helix transcriptional regulator n=1 Tax=Mycobacterium sp. MYCO198283 TaxID=2883505 RepID=UPI0027E0C7A7|nr:MarR family transcriptional regulator [Mycobacterium sp. MYCO198283]